MPLANTLLFTGSSQADLMEEALKFARALLGMKTSDLFIYKLEGKFHTIETMRSLIAEVNMAPFESPVKVFIIEDAERMLPPAANCLLKTLEEPTLHSYIVLLSTQPQQLLDTVVSRCRQTAFSSSSVAEKYKSEVQEIFQAVPKGHAAVQKLLVNLDAIDDPNCLLSQILHMAPRTEENLRLVESSRVALDHNIKLRTVLERLFLALAIKS